MITNHFLTVYGPVQSWRYGRSLGIDPIGLVSTCSFNCVYCQLGEIEQLTDHRQIFIPTSTVIKDFKSFFPWNVDVITLSGSGEPTLALNLGELIEEIKSLTDKKIVVLTNGTLLSHSQVRQDLIDCSIVSVKLDAIFQDQLTRVNRPVKSVNWENTWQGIREFRQSYSGCLSIQTMILTEWQPSTIKSYIELMNYLKPDEIQLNIPSRPKPLKRQLDGRGNHQSSDQRPYEVRQLKCISRESLIKIAQQVQQETRIKVSYP